MTPMKLFVTTQTAANRIQKVAKVFSVLGSNSASNGEYINVLNLDLIYFKFDIANNMWQSVDKVVDEFLSLDFYHSGSSASNEAEPSPAEDSSHNTVKDSLINRVKDRLFNKSVKTRISHRSIENSNIASSRDNASSVSTSTSEHVIDIQLKELVMPCGANNEYLGCIENGLSLRYNSVDKLPNMYYVSLANVYIRLVPSNTLSLLFEVNNLENMKSFLQQNSLVYEEISYDQLNKTNQLVVHAANIQIRFIARNQSLKSYWIENNSALLENTIKEIQHNHVTGDPGAAAGAKKYDGTDCWHEFRYILRKQPHKFL